MSWAPEALRTPEPGAVPVSGSGWESNPPWPRLSSPTNGFEDRGAHRGSSTPISDSGSLRSVEETSLIPPLT